MFAERWRSSKAPHPARRRETAEEKTIDFREITKTFSRRKTDADDASVRSNVLNTLKGEFVVTAFTWNRMIPAVVCRAAATWRHVHASCRWRVSDFSRSFIVALKIAAHVLSRVYKKNPENPENRKRLKQVFCFSCSATRSFCSVDDRPFSGTVRSRSTTTETRTLFVCNYYTSVYYENVYTCIMLRCARYAIRKSHRETGPLLARGKKYIGSDARV